MRVHQLSVTVFDRFLSRARGLLGRTDLLRSQGVLITPCKAVHTMGMDVVIDVVFVDRSMKVVGCVEELPPFRWTRSKATGTYSTLELACGEIRRRGIQLGDIINLCVPKENRHGQAFL